MDEIKRWEEVLQQAHAKAEAGGDDAEEAKNDAQFAADQIRRLQGIEQTYTQPEEGGKDVTDSLARPVAGGIGAGARWGMQTGKSYLQSRDAAQADAIIQAQARQKAMEEGSRKIPGASGTSNYTRVMPGQEIPEALVAQAEDMTRGQNPRGMGAYDIAERNAQNIAKQKAIGMGDWELKGKGTSQFVLPPGVSAPKAPEPSLLDLAKTKSMNIAKGVSEFPSQTLQKLMPYLGAYGVGSQGMDTINRAWNKDPIGAIISALGTAGAYTATKPGGLIPGGLTSLSAEAINYFRDHPDEFAKMLERTSGGGFPTTSEK